jgi:hypothetical protein
VVQALADNFLEADVAEWRIESVKCLKAKAKDTAGLLPSPESSLTLDDLRSNNMDPFSGWIRLSPDDNGFHSFLRCKKT